MDDHLQTIHDVIVSGNLAVIEANVQAALDSGIEADEILQQGMIPAMDEVGGRFEDGRYFVPEMLVSAKTMQSGLAILRPLLADSGVKPTGKIVIGSVKGDLHDIGKDLVSMMLEGAGYEIVDLGVDVSVQRFVKAIQPDTDMLAMSALLTTTMPIMKQVIETLERNGGRDSVKVIVGGAPVTKEFAAQIGADGFAADASQAAVLVKRLLG